MRICRLGIDGHLDLSGQNLTKVTFLFVKATGMARLARGLAYADMRMGISSDTTRSFFDSSGARHNEDHQEIDGIEAREDVRRCRKRTASNDLSHRLSRLTLDCHLRPILTFSSTPLKNHKSGRVQMKSSWCSNGESSDREDFPVLGGSKMIFLDGFLLIRDCYSCMTGGYPSNSLKPLR